MKCRPVSWKGSLIYPVTTRRHLLRDRFLRGGLEGQAQGLRPWVTNYRHTTQLGPGLPLLYPWGGGLKFHQEHDCAPVTSPVTSHWYAPRGPGHLHDPLSKPSMREDGSEPWGFAFIHSFKCLARLTYKHLLPSDLPNTSPLLKPSSTLISPKKPSLTPPSLCNVC